MPHTHAMQPNNCQVWQRHYLKCFNRQVWHIVECNLLRILCFHAVKILGGLNTQQSGRQTFNVHTTMGICHSDTSHDYYTWLHPFNGLFARTVQKSPLCWSSVLTLSKTVNKLTSTNSGQYSWCLEPISTLMAVFHINVGEPGWFLKVFLLH